MTVAPASRNLPPRLLWSPDDTDPGWFHTAEWELAAEWDVPAEQEWSAPAEQVVDITDAALAAARTAEQLLGAPQVELPSWLVASEPLGAAEIDPVPATVSLPRSLPRRRDLRAAAGAHHTLPARREVAAVPGLVVEPTPAAAPVRAAVAPAKAPVAARADDTTVLPRRRDLRRGRQLLVLPGAAVAAPPAAPASLTVEGDGLGEPVAAEVATGRRAARESSSRPSPVATTVARAGVVSVLVAVGVATIGGQQFGLGNGEAALTVGSVPTTEAGEAIRTAPLPAAPIDLWGRGVVDDVAPKFVGDTGALGREGLSAAVAPLAAAGELLREEQARQAEQARKAAEERARKAREQAASRADRVVSGSSVKALARSMMQAQYGWGDTQFQCLNSLWMKESGWNYRAQNPHSSAYGIPQALPGRKMASAGSDWRTNPATQIEWGLDYIHDRYGTPCGAWQFSKKHHYY